MSDLKRLYERVKELDVQGYSGNYIAILTGEGYSYDEIYMTVREIRGESKK